MLFSLPQKGEFWVFYLTRLLMDIYDMTPRALKTRLAAPTPSSLSILIRWRKEQLEALRSWRSTDHQIINSNWEFIEVFTKARTKVKLKRKIYGWKRKIFNVRLSRAQYSHKAIFLQLAVKFYVHSVLRKTFGCGKSRDY